MIDRQNLATYRDDCLGVVNNVWGPASKKFKNEFLECLDNRNYILQFNIKEKS